MPTDSGTAASPDRKPVPALSNVASGDGSVASVEEIRPDFEDFVGSEACVECHEAEYEMWRGSTHGWAGGKPEEVQMVAKFDGHPLRFRDAVVTPRWREDGRPVFVVEMEGADPEEIEVAAVVGGGHLYGGGTQSFFQEFPDGTLRFLPFDFSRQQDVWFVQRRRDRQWVPVSRDLALQTDLANWPPRRVMGTRIEFSNCQNCHGSQIITFYDETSRRYQTRFETLRVNCESCHGPGRRHVEICKQPGAENRADLAVETLATLSKDQSLRVCFQCHAEKDFIREDLYLPGADLASFYSLKMPLFGANPFRVDGRVNRFAYQLNHLFSDCYLHGSMTCVDCHDPHTQRYRDVWGQSLPGRMDNGQCTGCHPSKAVAPERHTFHKPDSPGSLCVACHMPFLQHQGVGSQIRYARSDHTIPIPRPAFDRQLGIENACEKCHAEKDAAWQDEWMRKWYGEIKPHHPMVANLIRAADVEDSREAASLLLVNESDHPMAQMAGLAAFVHRFLVPNMAEADPAMVGPLRTFAENPDPDLRALALMTLQICYDREPEIRAYVEEQRSRLGSGPDPIRNRWAIAAGHFADAFAARGDLPHAIACLEKARQVKPDNIVALSQLALYYLNVGEAERAVLTLQEAVRLRPTQASLHFQCAQLFERLQRWPQAAQALEEGLKYAPDDRAAQAMLERLRQFLSPARTE